MNKRNKPGMDEIASLRKLKPADPQPFDAAVLIPLCVYNKKLSVLLTLRSGKVSTHSGEVSFPGGKKELSETDYQTALRETFEEIGVSSNQIEIITRLNPVYSKHSLIVSPIVAFLPSLPSVVLSAEVSQIFYVELALFSKKRFYLKRDFGSFVLHDFMIDGARIWGMTAAILMEVANYLYKSEISKL